MSRVIKPDSGQSLVLQDEGGTAALTIDTSGDVSIANTLSSGTLGSSVVGGAMSVGTVSQSSGTPTGDIIEKGSGLNGEYIKFADGTLICFDENTGDTPRTFAAAFSAKCKVVATGLSNSTAFYVHDGLTTLTTTYYITQTSNKSIIAIGRWY